MKNRESKNKKGEFVTGLIVIVATILLTVTVLTFDKNSNQITGAETFNSLIGNPPQVKNISIDDTNNIVRSDQFIRIRANVTDDIDNATSLLVKAFRNSTEQIMLPKLLETKILDSSNDSQFAVGRSNSIVVGNDNFPRIAYVFGYDNILAGGTIIYIACTDLLCANSTTNNITDVGFYSKIDMVIGNDGLSRIVYDSSRGLFGSQHAFEYVKCNNQNCSNFSKRVFSDSNEIISSSVNRKPNLVLDNDDLAVIAMDLFASTSSRVGYYRCNNQNCSNVSGLTLPLTNPGSGSGPRESTPALDVGPNNLAKIISVNFDATGFNGLVYKNCLGVNCTSMNQTILVPAYDPSHQVGSSSAIAIGTDNFARIIYYKYDINTSISTIINATLNFINCPNENCEGANHTVLATFEDINGGLESALSLALDSNNLARITYYDKVTSSLVYLSCDNQQCTSKNITYFDTLGDVGSSNSISLSINNSAYISYYDKTKNSLKYALDTFSNIIFSIIKKPSDFNCISDGPCTISVNATDTSVNSNTTESITFTISNSEGINLINPLNNSFSNNLSKIFIFNYTDLSVSSTKCELFVDGNSISSNTSTLNNTNTQFNLTLAYSGMSKWYISCPNLLGSVGSSEIRTFITDLISPAAMYSSPTPANGATTNIPTIIINVTHNETNPDKIRLFIDGVLNETRNYSNGTNQFTNFTKEISGGVHNFSVSLNDTAGNSFNLGTIIITLDNTSTFNNSNLTNTSTFNSTITNSSLTNSNVSSSNISSSTISNSTISGSNISNSSTAGSTITNSSIINSLLTNSTAKNSSLSNTNSTNSTISNSSINNGAITNSNVINSNLTTSNISQSNVSNSNSTNSTITNSNVTNSTITNGTITNSVLTNVTLNNSTIINSTLINVSTTNSTVINSSVSNVIITNAKITGSSMTSGAITNSNLTNRSTVSGSTLTNSNVNNATIVNSTISNLIVNPGTVIINNQCNAGSIIYNNATLNCPISLITLYANLPIIQLNAPFNGQAISNNSIPFNISGTAADSTGISSVNVSINGTIFIATGTTNWHYMWTPATEGRYTIYATANDTDNNVAQSSTINVTIIFGSSITNSSTTNSNISNSTLTNSNSSNSNVNNSGVSNSTVSNSNVSSSNVNGSSLTNTSSNNSTISSSNVNSSSISNSNVSSSNLTSSTVANSSISTSNVTLSNLTNSSAISSIIQNSNAINSTVNGSSITTSTLTNSVSVNNSITGSTISSSTLINNTVTSSTISNSSTLINSTSTFSTVNNGSITSSTLTLATVIGSSVNSSSVANSLVTSSNVSSSSLINTNVNGSNVVNIISLNTNITQSNVSSSTLLNAVITNSNVTSSNLTNATITNSILTNANITNSGLSNSSVLGSVLTNSNSFGSNITSSIISSSNLSGSNVVQSNLSNSNIINSNLTNSNISNSSIINSSLSNSILTNSNASNSNVNNSNIFGTFITNGILSNSNTNLSNITNSNVTNSNLTSSNISQSSITNSTLTNAAITNSILINVTLNNSTAVNSTLINVGAINSTITNSTANNGTITNSLLANSNSTSSAITNSTLTSSNITNGSITNSNVNNTQIITSNLTNSNAVNSTISNSTLVNANITNSNIANSTITNTTLINSTFNNGIATNSFVNSTTSSNTNIASSTLTTSNLTNSSITNSSTTSSQITLSNLTNTTTINSSITNSTITNSNFTNSTIINSIVEEIRGDGWFIDPSIVKRASCADSPSCKIINSTIFDSVLKNTSFIRSIINNSKVNNTNSTDSRLINVTYINAIIIQSNDSFSIQLSGSLFLDPNDLFNNTYSGTVNITNSTVHNSNITNSIINSSFINQSTILNLVVRYNTTIINNQCTIGNFTYNSVPYTCPQNLNTIYNPPVPSGGGGGGGGGGGSGGGTISGILFCTPNWQCGNYSQCFPESKQYRTCTDLNNCNTTVAKPIEQQSCVVSPEVIEKPVEIIEEIAAPLKEMVRKVTVLYNGALSYFNEAYVSFAQFLFYAVLTITFLAITGNHLIKKKHQKKFMDDFYKLVYSLLAKGYSEKDVMNVLENRGWPSNFVRRFVPQVYEKEKQHYLASEEFLKLKQIKIIERPSTKEKDNSIILRRR